MWPEEPAAENEGADAAVAPGGDTYVAWERNVDTNLFGDPHIYEHIAWIPAGANAPLKGGRSNPVVITKGQINATPVGGVRSLDATVIAGYNRGTGNDFPRIAWDRVRGRAIGAVGRQAPAPARGHLAPLVLSIAWQPECDRAGERRLGLQPALPAGPVGSVERAHLHVVVRPAPVRARLGRYRLLRRVSAQHRCQPGRLPDHHRPDGLDEHVTGIVPNFGDYTDNASVGTTTYYTWSDGRLGVPQPFTDHH